MLLTIILSCAVLDVSLRVIGSRCQHAPDVDTLGEKLFIGFGRVLGFLLLAGCVYCILALWSHVVSRVFGI